MFTNNAVLWLAEWKRFAEIGMLVNNVGWGKLSDSVVVVNDIKY